jgi:hypothetical protein
MIGAFLATGIGRKLAAGAAIALGVLIAIWRIFAAGKEAARTEALETQVKNVEKAHAAKREVDAAHARGSVPDSVRKFYTD